MHTFPISLTETLILCFRQQTKEKVAFGYKMVTHPKTQVAKSAMSQANSTLLKLPPRSPDLPPIENLFHIASNKLKGQAVSQNITKESFEQFKQRAVNTMYSIRIETINNLIESMNARLNGVIRNKGRRARY